MYYFYNFTKKIKYIGIVGLILTAFSDLLIFKLLCFFGLFVFIEIAISFSTFKCIILQILGVFYAKKKYGEEVPSVSNYASNIEYSLPFDEKWTVINGCFTEKYSHSWDVPTQRYAYDFIILDDECKSYQGDFKNCENYYCYDKNILAPADGIIVDINNGSNDSLIYPKGKFFSKANHIAGNYIIIKHNDQEFSFLAHLKKDSISVKVGDTVCRGDIIAKCGNTGNSSEPHLHFQIQNGQSFYKSVGLPIRFSNIEIDTIDNYEKIDTRPYMNEDEILDGYITRGYSVSNKQNINTSTKKVI